MGLDLTTSRSQPEPKSRDSGAPVQIRSYKIFNSFDISQVPFVIENFSSPGLCVSDFPRENHRSREQLQSGLRLYTSFLTSSGVSSGLSHPIPLTGSSHPLLGVAAGRLVTDLTLLLVTNSIARLSREPRPHATAGQKRHDPQRGFSD